MSRLSHAGGQRRLEDKYGQTLAAYLQEMDRLGRQRGRLRCGDRAALDGYRKIQPGTYMPPERHLGQIGLSLSLVCRVVLH